MWTRPTLTCVLSAVLWCGLVPQGQETELIAEIADQQGAIDAVFTVPPPETIPSGGRGEQIRLGHEIVVHTQRYAKRYVGNKLNCTNCHLDAGLNPNAASFVGLSTQYPEYRARAGRKITLAERINECFQRSLNGKALSPNSSRLQAVIAYIEWLSQHVPRGSRIAWRGIPRISPSRLADPSMGKPSLPRNVSFAMGPTDKGRWPVHRSGDRVRIALPQEWRESASRRPLSRAICRVDGAGQSATTRRLTWRPTSTASRDPIFPEKSLTGRKAGNRKILSISRQEDHETFSLLSRWNAA